MNRDDGFYMISRFTSYSFFHPTFCENYKNCKDFCYLE